MHEVILSFYRKIAIGSAIAIVSGILFFHGCRKDPYFAANSAGFPREIAEIILPRCAMEGCHDEISNEAAAGLDLTSWESMFRGSSAGSPVIPYRTDQSFLLFFINTDTTLGPVVAPLMPFGDTLPGDEVLRLMDWVAAGAPNDRGFVKFSDNSNRSKFYVLNKMCHLVSVFDRDSRLIMRYVDTGNGLENGFPYSISTTPDGKSWLVNYNSGEFRKFNAATDKLTGEISLPSGNWWRSVKISSDSKKAYIAHWKGLSDWTGGQIAVIDIDSWTIDHVYEKPADSLYFPLGIEVNKAQTMLYAACYTGNFIYKMDISTPNSAIISKVMLNSAETVTHVTSAYRPSLIRLSGDESKYYVLCERERAVRIFQTNNDSLLAVITVSTTPVDMQLAEKNHLMFVSCEEDSTSFPTGKGSVFIININTNAVEKVIYTGYQPRGLAVDEEANMVYVANRNADPQGADAPHHYSDCDGNNGYVTIINMNTLQLVEGYKTETSVDPISVAIRN